MIKAQLVNVLMALIGTMFSFCAAAQSVEGLDSVAAKDKELDFLFGTHQPYHVFFQSFQNAVASEDKLEVAKMMAFPLRVGTQKLTKIKFLKRYNQIFTPHVTQVVREQHYSKLFARDQGVMFGDGEVWFSGFCLDGNVCQKLKIRVTGVSP